MEISAKRNENGEYQLEMGPVTFSLTDEVLTALHQVVKQRLGQHGLDAKNLHRKLHAYKAIASKLAYADDVIIQKIAMQLNAEQLVTLSRLADGDSLQKKVLRNLSKQNRRQFEEDHQALNQITEHSACLYMEQVIPLIKKIAQQQKAEAEND